MVVLIVLRRRNRLRSCLEIGWMIRKGFTLGSKDGDIDNLVRCRGERFLSVAEKPMGSDG